jgi:hypothetical protein
LAVDRVESQCALQFCEQSNVSCEEQQHELFRRDLVGLPILRVFAENGISNGVVVSYHPVDRMSAEKQEDKKAGPTSNNGPLTDAVKIKNDCAEIQDTSKGTSASSEPLWHVRHEDGDTEDLDEEEVMEAVLAYQQACHDLRKLMKQTVLQHNETPAAIVAETEMQSNTSQLSDSLPRETVPKSVLVTVPFEYWRWGQQLDFSRVLGLTGSQNHGTGSNCGGNGQKRARDARDSLFGTGASAVKSVRIAKQAWGDTHGEVVLRQGKHIDSKSISPQLSNYLYRPEHVQKMRVYKQKGSNNCG